MKFLISAGHGANDPGACHNGHTERDLMTQLRDKVVENLRRMGHEVATDGGIGENLPLREALKLVDGCDLAVEFHTNASENPTAKGVEVLSLPSLKTKSQKLASTISTVMLTPRRGEQGWRPQEESARGKLGFVQAGGMIVEVFFISNPEELADYLLSEDLLAQKIAFTLEE
jgi:N-acetylmuramoyl-L-alanine amidase